MGNIKSPYFLVFVASVLFGLPAIITKMLMDSLKPVEILSFRYIFIVASFPVVTVLFGKISMKELLRADKRELKVYFLLSFLIVSNMMLFFQSLYYINVNKALFLFLMNPIMALILARIFLNERITKTDILATLTSIAGAVMIFWKSISLSGVKGELMVLGAAILWSGYVVLNKYTANANTYRKTYWIFIFNSLLAMPLFFLLGDASSFTKISEWQLFLLLVLSFFSTLIPYTLMSYTAKFVKSLTSSIMLLLGPVTGLLLSFMVLKERPPANVIFGGTCILISAFISTYSVEKIFTASKKFAKRITAAFGY